MSFKSTAIQFAYDISLPSLAVQRVTFVLSKAYSQISAPKVLFAQQGLNKAKSVKALAKDAKKHTEKITHKC